RVTLPVAQALDLVDDRNLGIAGKDEVAMQRVRQPALDRATRRDHRLTDHLASEYALPARLRTVAAEQVHLDGLEVENGDQVDQAFGHFGTRSLPPASRREPESCTRFSGFQLRGVRLARNRGGGPCFATCFAQL